MPVFIYFDGTFVGRFLIKNSLLVNKMAVLGHFQDDKPNRSGISHIKNPKVFLLKKKNALYNILSINTKNERAKYDPEGGSNADGLNRRNRRHSLQYCNGAVVALGGAIN